MLKRPRLRFLCVVACLATAFVVLTATLLSAGATAQTQSRANVIVVKTVYRAWNGDLRRLHIVYPSGYSELRPGERLPLVIALHGAGGGANCDTSFGKTPAHYRFVVACLEGQGAATKSFSYGAPGQIRDQLRVPTLVHLRLPHLPLDPYRVIIVGASMGGLEALLAADLDPQLFAAVVALDAPVDLAAHYQNVAPRGEPNLKTKAMLAECGGTPELVADCYAMRSPLARMTRFGDTRIPLIMWWSSRDLIAGSEDGAPAYLAAMQTNFPWHPIYARIGAWEHGRALWSHGHLWLRDALALATANPQRRGADFG
jgi:pimeloyl-ACP methyl ester carboxylesterase